MREEGEQKESGGPKGGKRDVREGRVRGGEQVKEGRPCEELMSVHEECSARWRMIE